MPIILPYTVILVITWLVARQMPQNDQRVDISRQEDKSELFDLSFLLITAIILFFSAFRHIESPAIDEWIYRPRIELFRGISLTESLNMRYSKGISFMYWIAAKLFKTNQGSIIISTLFTVPVLMVGMRKYCYDFSIGVAMLLLTGYIATEFNAISQCIATAIFVFGFDRIYKGKFVQYCILVLICYQFHQTALFLFLIYFYVRLDQKPWEKIGTSIIAVGLIIVLYKQLPNYAGLIGLDEYSEVVMNGHHGVRWLSVIVSCCPAILSLLIDRTNFEDDEITKIVTNMVMLHAIIAIASCIDVYIARFELYTTPFIAIFYSRCARYIENSALFYYFLCMLYYIVFFYTYSDVYYFWQFS